MHDLPSLLQSIPPLYFWFRLALTRSYLFYLFKVIYCSTVKCETELKLLHIICPVMHTFVVFGQREEEGGSGGYRHIAEPQDIVDWACT